MKRFPIEFACYFEYCGVRTEVAACARLRQRKAARLRRSRSPRPNTLLRCQLAEDAKETEGELRQ